MEEASLSVIWLEEGDYAVISVNEKGHYRVHSTWAQDSSSVAGGIGYGALLGGLLGMLFGPGGGIAGAAMGGSLGGLIGDAENIDFKDSNLDDFAASLLPDTSALVIIGDKKVIDEFTTELSDFKVKTFITEIDEIAIDSLKDRMKIS